MLLGITHNPHSKEPETLFKDLQKESGIPERDYLDADIDKAGLQALKGQLSGK